jgi:hypothetical protein
MLRRVSRLALLLLAAPLGAQTSAAVKPPAAMKAIREQDIKRDLYIMGGDDMRGREAGTLDEMRASMWVAEEMRKIGLVPKGDMGSWFQWWNLRRTRISTTSSSVKMNGRTLALWTDITPATNTAVDISGTTLFVGDTRDTTVDVRGKIVVATLVPPAPTAIRSTTNTYEYNYTRPAITAMSNALARRGAAGVVIVADSIAEIAFDGVAKVQSRGTYDVVGGVPRFSRVPGGAATGAGGGRGAGGGQAAAVPVLLVHRNALAEWRTDGTPVDIKLRSETFDYPSVNVIGEVRGTDPKLRDEYVLFSSHQDHDGVRYIVAGDSIWNGADDNATTSVALLAIARAWVKQPSKRSALFVFHGAEERGLARLALSCRASRRPARQDRRRAQWRHARPQQPRHRGAHGLAATASQLDRVGADGDRREQRDEQVRHRLAMGSSGPSGRLVLPQRPRAVRRAARTVAVLLEQPAQRLPHTARRAEDDRLWKAHAHHAVDVHDRVARRQCGGASCC